MVEVAIMIMKQSVVLVVVVEVMVKVLTMVALVVVEKVLVHQEDLEVEMVQL